MMLEDILQNLISSAGTAGLFVALCAYYINKRDVAHQKEREAYRDLLDKQQDELLDIINKSNDSMHELKSKINSLYDISTKLLEKALNRRSADREGSSASRKTKS